MTTVTLGSKGNKSGIDETGTPPEDVVTPATPCPMYREVHARKTPKIAPVIYALIMRRSIEACFVHY